MPDKYTLYGTPLSLYSGKARAYLTYKQLPFDEVFSSLKVYKKVIIPNTGVRFVPVVKTPQNEYLQDTAAIIDRLEQRHTQRPVVPDSPTQKLVSYLFELWADEWLLIPAMHYRWNKENFPFIYQEFGKIIVPKMPAFIRSIIGKKIASKFKGFVPILGITPKTIPSIEDWYENDVLLHLNQHFAQHDYLLGGAPTLADFGLMGPLYAHLFRDPAPGKIMREKAPNVAQWVERMNKPITTPGELLADDQIPENLLPLLKRLFKEFWPVLTNTVSALEAWAQENPEVKEIPRTIGEHVFQIGEVAGTRVILPFHQWKLQRVLDCYQDLHTSHRQCVDEFLTQINASQAMHQVINKRVTRENNKLVFA